MARTAGGGGFRIRILGVDPIKRAFKKLPPKLARKAIRQAMRPAMRIVAKRVKELVPVDTGLTRSSVRVRAAKMGRKGLGVNVQIGAGDYLGETFYAAFVEYGTSRMPGRHFMRRAFLQQAKYARAFAQRQLLINIEKESKSLRASEPREK